MLDWFLISFNLIVLVCLMVQLIDGLISIVYPIKPLSLIVHVILSSTLLFNIIMEFRNVL